MLLPDELLFLSDILDQGNSPKCTAYTAVAVRQSMTSHIYDPEWQWQEELLFMGVKDAPGSDPTTQMDVGVKNGFSWVESPASVSASIVTAENAKAYFWVTRTGGMDWFDSIRQALAQMQRPFTVGVTWYNDWILPGGITPNTAFTILGGHSTKIAGFSKKGVYSGVVFPEAEGRLVIQGSWGKGVGDQGLFYFSRAMVNKYFGQYGIAYWSDSDVPVIQKLGLLSALWQNVYNLWIQWTAPGGKLPVQPPITPVPAPVPVPQPVPVPSIPTPPSGAVSRIDDWALAIQAQEGWSPTTRSFKNNNPGNLKFTTYTQSLGALRPDPGNFCMFMSYQAGHDALCRFLKDACSNQLVAFKGEMTLLQFTKVYAQPPNDNYALGVAKALKAEISDPINKFL